MSQKLTESFNIEFKEHDNDYKLVIRAKVSASKAKLECQSVLNMVLTANVGWKCISRHNSTLLNFYLYSTFQT